MRQFPGLSILSLSLVLGACTFGSKPPASPLPLYGEGDSYSFDDGTTRQVTELAGDRVVWRSDARSSFVTTRDVLLPPVQEDGPDMRVRRQVTAQPELFPLRPGARVQLQVDTERLSKGGLRSVDHSTGECEVGGPESVPTPAGTFRTIRVDCRLQDDSGGPAVQHAYFYAPSLGYYVRRDDRVGDGSTHSVTLTGYTTGNPPLSDSALHERVLGIQHALEQKVSGAALAWGDPRSGATGRVEPVATLRSPAKGWCRQFRERVTVTEREYDLVGTACRDPAGVWQVQEITSARVTSH